MFSKVSRGRHCRVAAMVAIAVTVAVLLSVSACLAGVRWTANGVVLRQLAGSDASSPLITTDGSDGVIVIWEDQRSGDQDIYAQRLDSGGNPLWTANGVALRQLAGSNARSIHITADGSGGAIVTWHDFRSGDEDIYAQKVDASGTPQWTANGVALRVVAGSDAYEPQITPDGSGGAIVTWEDYRNGVVEDIYAQKVDASGTPQWTANGVALRVAGGNAWSPQITTDGSGGAIVTWFDYRSGDFDIYAQKVNSGGTPQWTANGVALRQLAGSNAWSPQITTDGTGGAIVTWEDDRSGDWDIYVQRVNSGGTPQWAANGVALMQLAGSDARHPRITTDGSGGAIVTWRDERSGDRDIYVQRVNSGGTPQWTANGVALRQLAGSNATRPRITTDGSGGAIVTWYEGRSGDWDIYAQRVNYGGTPQWTANGVALRQLAGSNARNPQITTDGFGGAVVTWMDQRSGVWDIYAQRISRGPPTVISITPNSGTNDGAISITDLAGTGFFATDYGSGPVNPTVKLKKQGEADIDATNVNVVSGTQITCDFDLTGVAVGDWDVYVENPDTQNDTLARGFTVEQGGKPLGSMAWLVAEGSTGEGFDTFILMQNPNNVPAPTAVAFSTEDGIVDGTLLEIPANSRTTLRLSEYMPDQWGISTLVAAEVPIVVERSMYWNKGETAYPYEMMSGHANLGLPAPMEPGFKMDASADRSTDQYFPEGSTSGFDTWILLFNPMETEANAKVTLMDETGPVVEEDVTIGPLSRKTVHLNKLLPDANQVATRVESDTFLVAERSMYWDPDASDKQPYEMIGGHSTSGSPCAASNWFIAEGSTGGGFETYILLQNPQDTEAPVTLTFMDAQGVANQATTTMAAQSRSTFKVSDYVPGNFQVSTSVTSDVGVVAERSMYWNKRETTEASSMKDGHSTVGETGTGKTWMVAEGSTGGGFDTFILITNTENTEADVVVTFMTENGPQEPMIVNIPASSRYTLRISEYLPDTFQVSTLVQSENALVVERSMYWDDRVTSAEGNFPARPYECIGGHSANGLDP